MQKSKRESRINAGAASSGRWGCRKRILPFCPRFRSSSPENEIEKWLDTTTQWSLARGFVGGLEWTRTVEDRLPASAFEPVACPLDGTKTGCGRKVAYRSEDYIKSEGLTFESDSDLPSDSTVGTGKVENE